jgi:hypothetical protein
MSVCQLLCKCLSVAPCLALCAQVFRFFIQETQPVYQAILTPAVQRTRNDLVHMSRTTVSSSGEAASMLRGGGAIPYEGDPISGAGHLGPSKHQLDPSLGPSHGHSSGQRYAAVIVETRPHYALLYVVLNAVWYLPGWALHVVTSATNAGYAQRVLSPHVGATYHALDERSMGINDYNALMKVVVSFAVRDVGGM